MVYWVVDGWKYFKVVIWCERIKTTCYNSSGHFQNYVKLGDYSNKKKDISNIFNLLGPNVKFFAKIWGEKKNNFPFLDTNFVSLSVS